MNASVDRNTTGNAALDRSFASAAAHSSLPSYLLEARYEFIRLLRTPSFSLPTLLFPSMFYLLFGIVLNRSDSGDAARYLLATYGVFGVMGVGLFGFGVTVAIERKLGFLAYKRALPMPPGAYLFAKMTMAMIFSAMISLILAVIALSFGGVSLEPLQWVLLFVVNVIGVLPFCALGLYIGTLVAGEGAVAVINILYLPMAFLSGLWLPLTMLPAWIATAAPVWPSYHHAQIALKVIDMDAGGSIAIHLAALLAMTVVFSLLALRRLVRA
jgi:ABC-2 type transport system permease protein